MRRRTSAWCIALFALWNCFMVALLWALLAKPLPHPHSLNQPTSTSQRTVLVNQLACRIEWVKSAEWAESVDGDMVASTHFPHYTHVTPLPNGNTVILKRVGGIASGCLHCCFNEYILTPPTPTVRNSTKEPRRLKRLTEFCQTFSTVGEMRSRKSIAVSSWCWCERACGCGEGEDPRPILELHPLFRMSAPKTRVTQKVNFWASREEAEKPLKVVLLVMDELSRSELVGSLPLTFDLLKNNYVDLKGFSQSSADWVTNYMAMLTGLQSEAWDVACGFSETKSFTGCPFLWTDFRRANYVTSYFDYRRISPNERSSLVHAADYEWTPEFNQLLPNASESSFSRTWLELLLKCTLQFSRTFQSAATFSLTRIPTAHDLLPDLDLLLHRLLLTLEELKLYQNTLVILYSNSGRGLLEQQIQPILFMHCPTESFLHRSFSQSLERNADMLTSVHDVHETLKHVLRTACLQLPASSALVKGKTPQGISTCFALYPSAVAGGRSLLLPIPPSRSCADARIPHEVCQCEYAQKQTSRRASAERSLPETVQAAETALVYLNALIPEHGLCLNFSLASIEGVSGAEDATIGEERPTELVVRLSVKGQGHPLQEALAVEQRLRKVGGATALQPMGLPRWTSRERPNGYDCLSFSRHPKVFYHHQTYCLCRDVKSIS